MAQKDEERDDRDDEEERDEDESDSSAEDEASDDASGESSEGSDDDEKAESDDEGSDDEGSDDDEPEGDEAVEEPKKAAPSKKSEDEPDESSDEADEEPNAAAARVATALGVGDEDEAKDKDKEAEGPKNRAERRREEARERRRRRRTEEGPSQKKAKAGDDDDLPKDKNARAKELLLRRREEASKGRRGAVGSALLPGEMVDDALSRMAATASRWFRTNFSIIQWVLLAGLIGGGGYLFWASRTEGKAASVSGVLASAVAAERGKVMEEDKRSDEEKELDPSRIFKTSGERADAALQSYNQVVDQAPDSGAAILGKLGQAGVFLEKKEWQPALEAYSVVAVSTLAGADPDVKGRAIEGMGFAKEGKGDLDGALASFKELEGVDARGYKELALYHQARVALAKGEKEKAKELLKTAREKLQTPSTEGKTMPFLEAVVDESLRRIDPSAVPARTPFGGPKGNQMTPEEIQKLLEKARQGAEKRQQKQDEHGDGH